nr:hypothetical protein [Tanacetum cinerariifolium]
MTSITAQQTKLDLELVPKENRLDIRKCNGRIPRGLKPKEETFQVVLDTPCYPVFVITTDVPEVYMHQFWNFVYKHHDFYRLKMIKRKDSNLLWKSSKISFKFAQELRIKTLMPFPLKKTLHLFSENSIILGKEASQKYGAVLPECLTSPQIKESKAYKTYLGYATGTVPPKVARKFKKAYPSKKDSVPVPADEEPVQKGKRVKRSAKKSLTTPTTGIDLLSEVALTKEAQIKEVRKKSLRDFHKSHLSGSGSVAKKPQSVEKITPPVTSKGTDDINNKEGSEKENDSEEHELDSEQDTNGSESDSESDQQDNDDEVKDVDDDDEDDDDNDDDKSESDEDRGIDSDDVQDKKADVRMTDAQQEKENLEITQEQVVEDDHVTITKKTEVSVTSSSRSSDLASKFLNVLDIPPADIEIISPLDVHVHYKKQKTSKDAEPTISLKTKDSSSKSSKGTKSEPKSSRKSVHTEEPEFEVGDTDTPQGQEGNQGNDNDEPRTESASRRAWFTKPSRPQ